VYISLNADNFFTRIRFAIISLIGIRLQNAFIYFCSSISYSALNLTSDLYSFIIRRKSTIKQKLKTSAFIEKLCGASIGFYCYNLFPFNTFELFKFLVFVSSNYTFWVIWCLTKRTIYVYSHVTTFLLYFLIVEKIWICF
jgi:hypothetical protein